MKQWAHDYVDKAGLAKFVAEEGIGSYDVLLVQVNTSAVDPQHIEEVRSAITQVLPNAVIAGASSMLQFARSKLMKHHIVLGITAFEKSRLTLFEYIFPTRKECDYTAVVRNLEGLLQEDTKGILLLTNTIHFDIEALIKESNRFFPHIPIFGGISSSDEPFDNFIIFTQNRIFSEEGIVAVLMHGSALDVSCNYFFDWEPIGREFTVTRADGRYLYELDGERIIDVYEKYFGPLDTKKLLKLALAHPLIKYSKEFGPVARALLEIDNEKGLFTGKFVEGEKVQIGFGHYKRMMSRYEIIPEVYRDVPSQALWFYICISYQYGYLGILNASSTFYKEWEKIYALLTFGEFSHKAERNRFLNFTLTRVALSEESDARIKLNLTEVKHDPRDELLATLSTLVASSSSEIMDLNRHLEKEVEKRTKELAELNASLEKRIEQEVQRNREKDKMLYHQSKLAAMGEMINNIAHQWRQPLNIIALVMQDLSLKAHIGHLSPSAIAVAEKKINDTLKYLSDTIDDFRSFASGGEAYTHPGTLEVCKTVRETVRLVSIVLEDEKIGLKLSLQEKEVVVKGNPNDLKQVLLNLVYNAIDVLKERQIEEPVIKIEVKTIKNRVAIVVRDNGGGIDPRIIDKIFEPYFTTKYKARGTGLGLYMSKMIVEKRLGGKISARNTRSGAAFWMELPIRA
ncbi:FIST N-terminal domain-containing protein [Hydrogenimonas urashimensis]|uniref:FIST N-terminal domain-containing protein n=1 Tax=Hydrogenimonas urashimensis TaxID=2740515 RepID=UPI0019155F8D|nr:FIST N-terminal domain-containing protein [Hydrogenimonas urashimensis]